MDADSTQTLFDSKTTKFCKFSCNFCMADPRQPDPEKPLFEIRIRHVRIVSLK